jgi:integration host factor subunit alpha
MKPSPLEDNLSQESENLTRARLVEKIYTEQLGCTRKDLREIVDSVLDTMSSALLEETEVKISGFGKLKTKHKSARVGRNPQTDEQLIISKRRVVSFQPSRLLTKKLNE